MEENSVVNFQAVHKSIYTIFDCKLAGSRLRQWIISDKNENYSQAVVIIKILKKSMAEGFLSFIGIGMKIDFFKNT